MASYGDRELFVVDTPSSGAVFFLDRPARRTVEHITPDGWSIAAARGTSGLVVRGPALDSLDEALSHAEESAHIGLDVFAITGAMARVLTRLDALYVVWWHAQSGHVIRMCSSVTLRPEADMTLEVLDSEGNPVPSPPRTPIRWDPSFRYFRHAQTTSDLLDAFRNLYLALEAVLSAGIPPHGGEREVDWLGRALGTVATDVDLASYITTPAQDPVPVLVEQIYRNVRTATFHAKDGRRVILPYSASDRHALAAAARQLRRLYVDLVRVRLGVSFGWGTRVARAGYEGMFNAVPGRFEIYVSPTASVEPEGDQEAPAPVGSVVLPRRSMNISADGYAATLLAISTPDSSQLEIREFGGLVDSNVGAYERLEEPLSTSGATIVEVSLTVRGIEDGSAVPEYIT